VRLAVHPPETLALAAQPAPIGTAAPARRTLRVLVVDDNLDAAKILQLLVRECGHRAHMAHAGLAALAAALDDRPDVILLDIGLPEWDGYEVDLTTPTLAKGTKNVAKTQKMLRVLVVDDDRDGADSLGLLLEELGNQVHVTYGGMQALNVAAVFQPQLMLLDLAMPDVDGCGLG
jgi:CheY-like chemotaxis protein